MYSTAQVKKLWDMGELSDAEALMHLLSLYGQDDKAAIAVIALIVVNMHDRENHVEGWPLPVSSLVQ